MLQLRHLVSLDSPSIPVAMLRAGLRALAVPYSTAVRLRNLLYDLGLKKTHWAGVPVVSVGNLSVGGTGKTPMVSLVCETLRQHGIRVAVLSRGYGQLEDGLNDEALELEIRHPDVPHLQHWDRVASARIAVDELDMQVLVLDDGFQHRRLGRDLDIVLIDATDSDAALRTLPGGLLREPLSALRRSHLVVLTRSDAVATERLKTLKSKIARYTADVPIVESVHRATSLVAHTGECVEIDVLRSKPVLAFCGIGNPDAFFHQLEHLGCDLIDRRVFPDHYPYRREDVGQLRAWAKEHPRATAMICTMKDLVKLRTDRIGPLPLQALQIRMEITAGQSVWAAVWSDLVRRVTGQAEAET